MNRSWWGKFLLVLFFAVLSVVYVYPTAANLDLEKTKFPFKQKINLGLDLQGGLYMVLGVDFQKVLQDVADRQAQSLETGLKEENFEVKSVARVRDGAPADDPQMTVEFDPAKADALKDLLKKRFWTLRLVSDQPGKLTLGLAREYRNEIRDTTLNQSIEVIRNRIDEFGVTEPSIVSQGTDRVVVELPGVKDVERAKGLIGRTARLEFKIVNDEAMQPAAVQAMVAELEQKHQIAYKPGQQEFSAYVTKLNEVARADKKIPDDSEILFERPNLQPGQTDTGARFPYLVLRQAGVTGEDLADASVGFDENNRAVVNFSMTPAGSAALDRFTADRVGQRMAIILDNLVQSAPVLQARLSNGGRITLGSGNADELMTQAKDLTIVLRAGALPAKLDFLEQRVVGPSLGQDSIRRGVMGSLVGAALVVLFMIIYYKVSGLIASIAVALNLLFMVAFLVGLEATLTLPGIAGIALTVGIAVDSNVIIYERIRDELRNGKRILAAVEAGFGKAYRAIIDANLTSAAAAIVLFIYGTGPIKGFAVTLLIGIITTMFTAITFCRLMFDWWGEKLEQRGPDAALSI